MAIKQAAAGVGIALAGGVVAWYASQLPAAEKYRRPFMVAGIAAIGLGGLLAAVSLPDAVDEVKKELVSTRNAGGAIGVIGKLIFGQAPAGEIVKQRTVAADVSDLGKPKNIKGLVGKILSPRGGDYVERKAFSGTYEVTIAVANVGEDEIDDVASITVDETPSLQADGHASGNTDVLTLTPGGPEQILTVRVPVALSLTVPFETIPVTARLYLAGFLLDKVEFTRE